MKKNLILPLVLSASALLVASCGEQPASSASSSVESSESTEQTSEYVPNYDYVEPYADPADWSNIKGVEGGKTGVSNLVGESVAKKTEILGALEKYAVDNYITGMPLFENGGYAMYNPRISKGTENYIVGYGFGTIREGFLKSPLEGVEKPTYYHSYEANDPQKINYLDDSGSQVGDLYGNMASAFFGTKMSADKTKYDWYGVLSKKDRPVLLDVAEDGTKTVAEDQTKTGNTWRIYVRTGEEGGAQYRTASKLDDRKAFDKKAIALEDYVNAFKILLCGKFAYYRGTELAGQTGYSGIVGAANYYNESKGGFGTEKAEAAWSKVGIVPGHDEVEGDYIDFTLMAPTTRFYAMYSLGSNLYAPINLDFFKLVTNDFENPEFYGAFNTDKTTSPVDNILSTGPYMLESWETDKAITFARNPEWWEIKADPNVYRIEGLYNTILTAINTDSNAAIKEFLLGNIDSCGIPTDYLSRFKNDPRTKQVPGDSVFKLNLNTTTAEQWEALFGENGSISQTPKSGYWNVKPWMSNENFVSGLFYSINRDEFATKNGSISSINYFSSNYMSDPEGGVSYNTTDAHANALKDFWGDTVETGGFSSTLAQAAFSQSVDELIASEDVAPGDEISIEIWWMYTSHISRYGEDIAKYIQDAFNESPKAKANNIKLTVDNKAVDVWSDVYYKHLMVGQFDLGFGSISGNSLDPLNFMEVLKSNNSSGFTLNWGPDTSALDLEFDGAKWSFDNLWAAADHGVVTYRGQELPPVVVTYGKSEFDEEGNLIVEFSVQTAKAFMAQKAAKENDADAQAIADLSDEVYYIGFEAVYVTDWATVKVSGGYDAEGNAVMDDDYLGYGLISEFGLEIIDRKGEVKVTYGVTQDLLGYFGGGEATGALYYGCDAFQKIGGVESSYETEGILLFADTAALAE